jgi:ubiquinone/menaquinone biosynthesis C-methylase UbiE
LEFVALGGSLERARFVWLDALAGATSVLVLGEGDGRCLARLVRIAPAARIHCVDASRAMLATAGARLASSDHSAHVRFTHADARDLAFAPGTYDAIVTLFFLDCFTAGELEHLVPRLAGALRPGGHWLYADFAEPAGRLARWRARTWLAVLYAFFRWQTGLRVRRLPPAERLLERNGLVPRRSRDFQGGMLRSVLFERRAIAASAAAPARASTTR